MNRGRLCAPLDERQLLLVGADDHAAVACIV